jgi:hypothetical protein
MNYLAIIALCLGLLSTVITLKVLNKYDELNTRLSSVTITTKQIAPEELVKIQDTLKIDDNELRKRLQKKEEAITSVLKEPFKQVERFLSKRELFENFSDKNAQYLTIQQRQYSMDLPIDTTPIIRSIETEPSQQIYTYDNDITLSQYAIEHQPKGTTQVKFASPE